ncbi:MAG: aminoacyl-tRNA deacylase [Blastocatellia bacterium]|nr:aminoacyl-tRNA deacylase [Blastocatellia bacterium]
MEKSNYPITPAIRLLREKKIAFEPRLYDYKDHGGTERAAASLNLPEHAVIKTIVMETDARRPLIVLMHGDSEVSTKELAQTLAVKSISPCDTAAVQKYTGYMVGGVSPFGTRTRLPVYAEKTIFDLPRIHINGGKRGFLISIDPQLLREVLPIEEVEVAIPRR